MNKLATWLILAIFAVTLTVLAIHIFPETAESLLPSASQPDLAPTSEYTKMKEYNLGYVEVSDYQRMGFTGAAAAFSPDSQLLAVGTDNGMILVIDRQGRKLWQRTLGLGKVTAMAFSRDSRLLFVGETSQQGSLICLEAASGSEVWRSDSSSDIGVDIRHKSFPGIVWLGTDRFGNVYAVAHRYAKVANISSYHGRIYKFEPTGRQVAVFPADHNLDAWVTWAGVDEDGERLVFGTSNYERMQDARYCDTVYCLDGLLSTIVWSDWIEPTPTYATTALRKSPEISGDGSLIAGIASDGRCFMYSADGRLLWQRTVSQPHTVSGVQLNASGLFARFYGDYVVFTTGNTYNRANWQLQTPIDHPNSNSVFVFDKNGRFVSRFKAGGMIEQMAIVDRYAILAVGRNVRTKEAAVHGAYVLSLPQAEVRAALSTAGPCVAAAISPDGRSVAAVEAPLKLDNGQIIGSYRLHLWQKGNLIDNK